MKLTHLALAGSLLVPTVAAAAEPSASGAAPAASKPSRAALGPVVTNAAGQQGHLHTVAPGETLWDVSEAYLGTPWVWPSLWKGRSSSSGDATIAPGDVLWVSSTEIRPLTPTEVASLRASAPASPASDAASGGRYDADRGVSANAIDRWVAFNARGFIATRRPALVGEIIGNPTVRAALGTGDVVYIDLGAGDVQVGDRLRVVRAARNIPDPDTGRLIGTFVEPLAWAEVTQLEQESAAAVLQGAVTEVMLGDKLLKADPDENISIQATSTSPQVSGEIVHMVGERVIGGGMDVVYLDHGSASGLAPGSALEVVRSGGMVFDPVKGRNVKVPDTVVGHLIVITSDEASASAYVLHSTTDLVRGDRWRGAEVR